MPTNPWRQIRRTCALAGILLLAMLCASCRNEPQEEPSLTILCRTRASPFTGMVVFTGEAPEPVQSPSRAEQPGRELYLRTLDLTTSRIGEVAAGRLIIDPEGRWLLGCEAHGYWLMTQNDTHRLAGRPYGPPCTELPPLDASRIFLGPGGYAITIGATQHARNAPDDPFSYPGVNAVAFPVDSSSAASSPPTDALWTFSAAPEPHQASRWRHSAASWYGDWSFGSSPSELYVEEGGYIFRGQIDWPAERYEVVSFGFCPAAMPNGTVAFAGPQRRHIQVRTPEGHISTYPLPAEIGPVIDIQWAPQSCGPALLYRHSLQHKPITSSTEHLAAGLSILDLRTGSHYPLFPGEFIGSDGSAYYIPSAAAAQWVAGLPRSPEDLARRGHYLNYAATPPDPTPSPPVCNECLNVAQSLAEAGLSDRPVLIPHLTDSRVISASRRSSQLHVWSFTFEGSSGARAEVEVLHECHRPISVHITDERDRQALNATARRTEIRQIIDRSISAMRSVSSSPKSQVRTAQSNRADSDPAPRQYSVTLDIDGLQVEAPGPLVVNVLPSTGLSIRIGYELHDTPLAALITMPEADTASAAITTALQELGVSPTQVHIAPFEPLERGDGEGTSQRWFWQTALVHKQAGTALFGDGHKWAQLRFFDNQEFNVLVKHAGYPFDPFWQSTQFRWPSGTKSPRNPGPPPHGR